MALTAAQQKQLAEIKKQAEAIQKQITAKAAEEAAAKRQAPPRSNTPTPVPPPRSNPSSALRDMSIGLSNGTIKTQDDLNRGSNASSGLYPMGALSLMRFTGAGPTGVMNENTIWLVDPDSKTLRPFTNAAALSNFFDGEVDISQIIPEPAESLMPGGRYGGMNGQAGFQILSSDYAIRPNGSARRLEFSNSQLSTRYGLPADLEHEKKMYSSFKGLLNILETSGIEKSTIDKIRNSNDHMAFYVSAMGYGGYGIGDVYSDIKKRELGITNLMPISATSNKRTYAATKEYQRVATDSRLAPPVGLAGMNVAQLDLPIYKLPQELFNTLVPLLDINSKEFKDALASVETSYYDLLEQQLRATTEQDKAVADYNYQEWKNDVERNLGLQLSDNAMEAWSQIQQASASGAERGIQDSGIQAEGIDTYLRRVRQNDSREREVNQTAEERQRMTYFLSSASASEIKDLVNSDPETARKWGLIPSDEIKSALTLTALKAKYPTASEENLARYISVILDENGNYRSQIYQKQMGTLEDIDIRSADTGSITGIKTIKNEKAREILYDRNKIKEEDAYKEFTDPEVPFLRASDSKAFEKIAGLKPSSGKTDNFSSAIKQAGGNLNVTPRANDAPPVSVPITPNPAGSQQTQASLMSQMKEAQAALDRVTGKSPAQGVTPPTPTGTTNSALKNFSIQNSPKVNTPSSSAPTQASLMSQMKEAQAALDRVTGSQGGSSSGSSRPSSGSSSSNNRPVSSGSSSVSAASRARDRRRASGRKR